ncbi:MAG: hypothetical protein WC485_08720, partial [Opitutaceae bacterium]
EGAQPPPAGNSATEDGGAVHITVDGGKVLNVMRGGIGASWHAIDQAIPCGQPHPVFLLETHGGSAWGGYPPADDERAWQQIYRHASWLGLDWNRVEIEQRIYEPERNRFTFDSPEMRILCRILDWHQQHGADVFFQQMWSNVGWLAYPEFRDDPIARVHSGPADLDAFADGLATLMEHLIKERGYTCIKWLCITNEPGEKWSWWQQPPNTPLSLRPGLVAVRKALDRRGLSLPLSGPDSTATNGTAGLPNGVPAGIDCLDVVNAYDFHNYGVDFDCKTRGFLASQEHNAIAWSQYAHDENKPLFITEFGSMAFPFRPDKPGPSCPQAVLAGSELIVRMANAGVDGFNRWSFLNRGDLDGQWQMIETWDRQKQEMLTDYTPHPNSYFGAGLLPRFTAKHSAVLACAVTGGRIGDWNRVFAAAFRSPRGHLTVAVVNDAAQAFRLELQIREPSRPLVLHRYRYGEAEYDRTDVRVDPQGRFPIGPGAAALRDTIPPGSLTLYSSYELGHDAPGVVTESDDGSAPEDATLAARK